MSESDARGSRCESDCEDGYQIVNPVNAIEQEMTSLPHDDPISELPPEIADEIRAVNCGDSVCATQTDAYNELNTPEDVISAPLEHGTRRLTDEEHKAQEVSFEPHDGDSMNRAIAKSLLRDLNKDHEKHEIPIKRAKNAFIASQEIINRHLRVLEEMMELAPVDLGREAMIIYICKTFCCAGLSDAAGKKYAELGYADQVGLVLSIARAYVIPRWVEVSDEICAMKHAAMEEFAQLYVNLIWHPSRDCEECCLCQ